MAEEPTGIRGAVAQDQLTAMRELPEWPQIEARLGPDLIATVEKFSRVGWVDGDINFEMTESIHQFLGMERGKQFYYDTFNAAWDTPLFRTVVRGSVRLLGSDPGGLLKMLPKGQSMVFRGFGTYKVLERGDDYLDLQHFDIPPRCFNRDSAWIRFAAFSQLSVVALAGVEGQVTVETDPVDREAIHHFTWSDPSKE